MSSTDNQTTQDDYSVCGSADCQDPNITGQNLDRYIPDEKSLYIMIGVLLFIDLCAVLLHLKVLPNISSSDASQQNQKEVHHISTVSKNMHDNNAFDAKEIGHGITQPPVNLNKLNVKSPKSWDEVTFNR